MNSLQPRVPFYMSQDLQQYAVLVFEHLCSVAILVFDFMDKHELHDARMVNLDTLENHSCKIALRHMSYEKAIDLVGKSLEKSLTRHYMHIIDEDKRISFFADAQILLNQVHDMKAQPPAGLDELPPRIVIKRFPVDNQTEAE